MIRMCGAAIYGLLLFAGLMEAQMPSVKLNGGLEAQVLSIGRTRDHRHLTVSVRLLNKSKYTAALLLVDNPLAVDNAGGSFNTLESVSGVAQCRWSPSGACVAIPEKNNGTIPLQNFTLLDSSDDPNGGIILNFRLNGTADGPLISFSAHLYYRLISDPLKEVSVPEMQQYRQFRLMTLSFAGAPVVDAK